jgi:parallel beta-helix repeat protein
LLRGNNTVIQNCEIIRQDQLGFGIGFGWNGLVEDVEVAFANHNKRYEWEWEAGGCKNWQTGDLVLRRVHSHDNQGPGLWSDNANVNTLYENNHCHNNRGPGIFHEISHGATMRSNVLMDNGYPVTEEEKHHPYIPRGGFLLAQAGEVILEDNLVDGDVHGVIALNQCRDWDSHIGITTGNTTCIARRNVLRNIAGVTVEAVTDCGQMPTLDWDSSNSIE